MTQLRLSTLIAAPPEDCYRLALTVDVQERALARVRARAVAAGPDRLLQPGETITWRAHWLGLAWRMTTRIVSADPPAGFADEQVRGPFGHWHHDHRFTPYDGGTLMEDAVDWSAPFAVAGTIAVVMGLGRFVADLLRDHNQRLAAEIGGTLGTAEADPAR